MENQQLIDLTADIVASHVANNAVAVGDVSNLINQVHSALASLDSKPPEEPQGKTPMVSARASVKRDYIVCMECGAKQKMLKRHLGTAHNMTPDQYRTDYSLPKDYPMVAPGYSDQRRELAHKMGLGRKPRSRKEGEGPAPAPKNGRRRRKAPVEA